MPLLNTLLSFVSLRRYEALSRIRSRSQLANRLAVFFGNRLRNRDLVIQRGCGKGVRFNPGHGYISQVLGTWEPDVIDTLDKILKPGMIFCDIGANNGFFSVIAAKLVGPKGAVYAIDPLPINIEQIKNNVRLNDFRNVNIYEMAMGAVNDRAKLSVSANSGMSRLQAVSDAPDPMQTILVDLRTLDTLVAEKGLQDPGFIKIDAEGAEAFILEGAAKILQRSHPALLIELHGTNQAVEEVLTRFGYTITPLENPEGSLMDVGMTGHIVARYPTPTTEEKSQACATTPLR
jgi:FkbM family methyltransferase